ncbi:MAG: hypothetical protein IPP43_13650 [Chitinophagaceae bacterium]|nr:hypothetical protein [Chitinophagaceae bacterium]
MLIFPVLLLLTSLSSFTKPQCAGKKSTACHHWKFYLRYDWLNYGLSLRPNPETIVDNSGQLHENYTLIIHPNGSWNFSSHLNAQNCSGTGQISGNNYQLPGSTSFTYNGNPDTGEFIVFYSRYNFRMNSQEILPMPELGSSLNISTTEMAWK